MIQSVHIKRKRDNAAGRAAAYSALPLVLSASCSQSVPGEIIVEVVLSCSVKGFISFDVEKVNS
jgi:hypothetical protein